jgi:cellulose synthase/poly-beta-1,6-N-acetylglucosamine synthase-like glycosyltransferase
MLTLFLVSVAVLAYVLVGYPLLLRLLVAIRGPRTVQQADILPGVSFIISAYNEAAVIRGKLENALAFDYPSAKREIVVISDCSDDDTDEIVKGFADRGVGLVRTPAREGKTAGLNYTIPNLTGEIVVFSDANAMYEPDALRMLVRNFADPTVGYVTGEARYLKTGEAAADVGERAYWGYEMQMKRLETQLGSMVGGDGAIYAIRRSLWRPLPVDAINDLLNPLQIVAAGWRGVYEPEAVCWEETAGGIRAEYRRRVRIVSRSWRAVFQAGSVLNPFAVGFFAWSLWSHKVLRWASGLFVLGASIGGVGIYVEAVRTLPVPVGITSAFAVAVAVATSQGRRSIATVSYFLAISAASLVGLAKGTLGRVSGVWSTPRATNNSSAGPRPGLIPVGGIFLLVVALATALTTLSPARIGARSATILFWVSLVTLVYVYAGYPLLLAVMRWWRPRPIRRTPIELRICLFIAANDEEAVIEAKLQNALLLDYPADNLEIVVASDGSVDATNEIVRRFAPRVRLLEFHPRQGKMAAINRGLTTVDCEIVVFSDANTFLDRGALRALAANFADPSVGGASGDVALVGERASLASSEDLYHAYERWVQQAESSIGSMIGADGALYAIRRKLFEPPAADTILDDMAVPMAIVRHGYRMVFEPEARASEQGVERARDEFWRKVRVVAGAVQFMTRRDSSVPISMPQVVVSLVSHKALRWLSPAFATVLLLSSVGLAGVSNQFAAIAMAQGILIIIGLSGCLPRLRTLPPVALAHYFLLVQAAAALGFVRGLSGRQSVLWRRFARVHAGQTQRDLPVGVDPGVSLATGERLGYTEARKE